MARSSAFRGVDLSDELDDHAALAALGEVDVPDFHDQLTPLTGDGKVSVT